MRRKLTEQPRVLAAQVLIVIAVLAGAMFLGAEVADRGKGESPAQAAELTRTRDALRRQRTDTLEARRDSDRLRTRMGSQRRRRVALERRARSLNRRLDRALRRLARRSSR